MTLYAPSSAEHLEQVRTAQTGLTVFSHFFARFHRTVASVSEIFPFPKVHSQLLSGVEPH